MKKLYIWLLVFSLFGGLSCKDFLDVKPNGSLEAEKSWENITDFTRHWRGVYATLKSASGFTEAVRLYGDLQCDLAYSVQGNDNLLREVYQWNFNASTSEISTIWYAMWRTIAEINDLFDHMPLLRERISGQDSIDMEYMLGDMYMLRALCYSKLTEYYCDAYNPANAEEQLGMPICRTANVGKPARASLKATYDFMYEDLQKAVELLDPLTYQLVMMRRNFLCSRQSALALWARISLNRKDYQVAAAKGEEALTACLNTGMRLDVDTLLYGNLFRGTDYGEELLFFLGMHAEDATGSVGSLFCEEPYGYYHPQFVPSSYLLNLYSENDIRKQVFFDAISPTDYSHGLRWYIVLKDGHNKELDISSVNYAYQSMPKLFRLSELYLIIAEANAMMGNGDLDRANDLLATLREVRIFGYEREDYDAAELMRQIKMERVRELCFEGFRLPDLKRWGDGFRRQPQEYTTYNDLVIEAENNRFTWPIPKNELEVNANMQPNASN